MYTKQLQSCLEHNNCSLFSSPKLLIKAGTDLVIVLCAYKFQKIIQHIMSRGTVIGPSSNTNHFSQLASPCDNRRLALANKIDKLV